MRVKFFNSWKQVIQYSSFIFLIGIASWAASGLPSADWGPVLYPALRSALHGQSPYTIQNYMNPPWTAVLTAPIVIFPMPYARGLLFVLSALAMFYSAWRAKANYIAVIALLLSPTAIGALIAGNLDALVQLGIFLPPALGLLVLMIKPQIGIGVSLYYLIQTWRKSKVKGIVVRFAPVILAYLAGWALFPVWGERIFHQTADIWNRSIFPYGIPIGLWFLWQAVKHENIFFALAASPFLTPYLTFYTYAIVQIGLLHPDVENFIRRDILQISLSLFLWIIMLIFKL